MKNKKKWYNKAGLVIILLIFFFPVGIYALWKSELFKKSTKIITTIITIVGALLIVSGVKGHQARIEMCNIAYISSLWAHEGTTQVYIIIFKQNPNYCVHIMDAPKGYFILKGQNIMQHNENTQNDLDGPYLDLKSAFDVAINLKSMWLNTASYYKIDNGYIYDISSGKKWDSYCK